MKNDMFYLYLRYSKYSLLLSYCSGVHSFAGSGADQEEMYETLSTHLNTHIHMHFYNC